MAVLVAPHVRHPGADSRQRSRGGHDGGDSKVRIVAIEPFPAFSLSDLFDIFLPEVLSKKHCSWYCAKKGASKVFYFSLDRCYPSHAVGTK